MILKSFLSGFIAYVLAVVYSLLQGSSLKVVFLTGIKFLFAVTLIALIFQLIFLHFNSQTAANSEQEKDKKEPKDKDAEQTEKKQSETDEFTEDFSPLNPPEIEYEDQNEL